MISSLDTAPCCIPDSAGIVCNQDTSAIVKQLSAFQDSVLHSNSMVYSFWISIAAIFIIYALKYAFGIKPNGEKFIPSLVEFFLDVCISLIPLIAIGSHSVDKDVFGIMMILLSVIVVIIGIYLRKLHNDYYSKTNSINTKSVLCAIGAILLCITLITVVFIFISKLWN